MPEKMQIRHIAVRSENPDELSSFYEKTFGLRVVRRNPRGNKSSVYMTDGYMHLAINASDGEKPNGIWHFGLLVPTLKTDTGDNSGPSRRERAGPPYRELYHRSSG